MAEAAGPGWGRMVWVALAVSVLATMVAMTEAPGAPVAGKGWQADRVNKNTTNRSMDRVRMNGSLPDKFLPFYGICINFVTDPYHPTWILLPIRGTVFKLD
jgi:hypothetical protein